MSSDNTMTVSDRLLRKVPDAAREQNLAEIVRDGLNEVGKLFGGNAQASRSAEANQMLDGFQLTGHQNNERAQESAEQAQYRQLREHTALGYTARRMLNTDASYEQHAGVRGNFQSYAGHGAFGSNFQAHPMTNIGAAETQNYYRQHQPAQGYYNRPMNTGLGDAAYNAMTVSRSWQGYAASGRGGFHSYAH